MKLKSNEPFFLLKNGLKHSYPSVYEDLKTDILIVGCGITGSLIAHQCMEDGWDTLIIDRREIGHGSTSATTSMLQYEIDIQLHELIDLIGEKAAVESYKACYESIDTLEKICKNIGSNCGFVRKKSLYYAARKKDQKRLKKEFECRLENGFDVQWLSAEQILDQFGIHQSYGGIVSAQGASIDAFCLAHELLAFNHNRGLRVFDKTNIEKVKNISNGIVAITEYGYKISAKKIIYCTGFESVELISEDIVNLLSTYAIVTEVLPDKRAELDQLLVWNTAEPYLYMRTTDDNRLLIGGEDDKYSNAKKRDARLNKKQKRLLRHLQNLLSDDDLRADFSWAGTFGETKDGLPFIGVHEDFPDAYFVLGFGGNGITFSVIGMEMLSYFLQNKVHPLDDYFRFGR